jgi:hypothetical protein
MSERAELRGGTETALRVPDDFLLLSCRPEYLRHVQVIDVTSQRSLTGCQNVQWPVIDSQR